MSRRPRLLVITGNAGVGKTTTAKAWAEHAAGAAILGDDVYLWMRQRSFRRAERHRVETVANIAIAAASEFLNLGLDVAIEYVWWPSSLARFESDLVPYADIRCVRLVCDDDTNLRRNLARPTGVLPPEVIHELGHELAILEWPESVVTIDVSKLTIASVLNDFDALWL